MKKSLFIISVILLTSCVQNELDNSDPSLKTGHYNELNIQPISHFTSNGNINTLSVFQSDIDICLLRYIHIEKGELVLSMTLEDAEKIGIPQDKYQYYVTLLKSDIE